MNDTELRFVESFRIVQDQVSQNEIDKGFRNDELARYFICGDDGEFKQVDLRYLFKSRRVALEQSELSEYLESIRNYKGSDEHCPDFSNEEIELADTIIRIMTHANCYNLRVAEAIIAKHNFNVSRPMKHGKAF